MLALFLNAKLRSRVCLRVVCTVLVVSGLTASKVGLKGAHAG